MGAVDANLLREFWGTFYSQVNSADTEAAFQIGIWDIVNGSNLSLLTGNFIADPSVYGTDPTQWPSFLQTAQNWLTQLGSGQNLGYASDLVGLQSGTYQDQLAVLPVPPGLTLMGIGSIGLVFNGCAGAGRQLGDRLGAAIYRSAAPLSGPCLANTHAANRLPVAATD